MIVASRPDGLGTRLLTFAYARCLAEILNQELIVLWPSLEDNNYNKNILRSDSFMKIFESDDVFIDEKFGHRRSDVSGSNIISINNSREMLSSLTLEEAVEKLTSYDYVFYDVPFPLYFSNYSMNDFSARLADLWNMFNFKKEIKYKMGEFCRENNIVNATAIHVRRGDVEKIIINSSLDFLKERGITQIFQRYIPLKSIFSSIESLPSAVSNVLVCSEDLSIVGMLKEKYPDIKFCSTSSIYDPQTDEGSLADLIALASVKKIICPFKSFYSECAATFGGAEMIRKFDVIALSEEIIPIINSSDVGDKHHRRALVYATAWSNLWNAVGSPERAKIYHLAKKEDSYFVDDILQRK